MAGQVYESDSTSYTTSHSSIYNILKITKKKKEEKPNSRYNLVHFTGNATHACFFVTRFNIIFFLQKLYRRKEKKRNEGGGDKNETERVRQRRNTHIYMYNYYLTYKNIYLNSRVIIV